MMDQFEFYLPIKWLEDGLVVVSPVRKPKPLKVVKRPGTLRIALSTMVLSIGLASVNMSLAAEPVGVGNIRAFELSVAARNDEHVVPPHYWDNLITAMREVPRLPAQTTKSDPPAAF